MNIGDKLPEILGVDQNGQEVRTSEYAGRKVILYFYPKDQTPGCTAEACSLRDNYNELTQMGYEVIGVSADSAESHQKFIAAHELPFRLIAERHGSVGREEPLWQNHGWTLAHYLPHRRRRKGGKHLHPWSDSHQRARSANY